MGLRMGIILILLWFVSIAITVCVCEARDKRKTRELNERLNSPFFRNVTDGYYRVGNISGVGR
jgi:hypothetical protein